MLAASGAYEPAYPAKVEFTAGGNKGNESLEQEGLTVSDKTRFKAFIDDATSQLQNEFNLESAFQRYHGIGVNPHRLYTRKLNNSANINSFSILVAWSVSFWDPRRIAVAKCLAHALNRNIADKQAIEYDPDLKVKKCGF